MDAALLSAADALSLVNAGDHALARLDVLPGLDGVEPGLLALLRLHRRGVRVLNRAAALLAAHVKLRTARLLKAGALPHPRTTLHVSPSGDTAQVEVPVVLKPRFGSWGRDVVRCDDRRALESTFAAIRDRPWFRRHGVLAQELLPVTGSDLRIIVACGQIQGAVMRIAAQGEWRTNVSLGGSFEPADPPPVARTLACAAAAAIGADVIGVDLFPVDGRFVVLELNGAVDFDASSSLAGGDVYDDLIRALARTMVSSSPRQRSAAATIRPRRVPMNVVSAMSLKPRRFTNGGEERWSA
jgi:[lysine-biosynthesis-protein LysW]--L-2-aminoadipate ligase